MIIKAELNRYRQAPRKVRLLASLVKGKKIEEAIALISFSGKKAGEPMIKLINSGVANAIHNFKLSKDVLYIKDIRVDGGIVLKRGMPRAFGRSFPIKKRTSHVSLDLGVNETEIKKIEKPVEPKKKVVKKTVTKKKVATKVK
ncbi:MAG: 50S ribosomal protein L22 [bacterium]